MMYERYIDENVALSLRQTFPLRETTLRHVAEVDGRYLRAMTPNDYVYEMNNSSKIVPYKESDHMHLWLSYV